MHSVKAGMILRLEVMRSTEEDIAQLLCVQVNGYSQCLVALFPVYACRPSKEIPKERELDVIQPCRIVEKVVLPAEDLHLFARRRLFHAAGTYGPADFTTLVVEDSLNC